MKKKISKKLIALLCAVAVTLTSISFSFQAKAEDTPTTNFKETEYAHWEKFTFSSFQWDEVVTQSSTLAMGGYGQTFANKVFSADITYLDDGYVGLYFGGAHGNWNGFTLSSAAGSKNLTLGIQGESYTLTPENTGSTLVGETFNLKLSYDHQDTDGDGNGDQLKLGVWINNILYNDTYIDVTKYKNSDYTYEEYLSGYTMVEAYGPRVKLESWKPGTGENFRESEYAHWEKFTFSNFGWEETVTQNSTLAKGGYGKTFANKVFSGDITYLDDGYIGLYFGGAHDNWNGFTLSSAQGSENLTLSIGGKSYTLTPENTGSTLVGKLFNLKLSYDHQDTNGDGTGDRLKLGVWINNVLYNDAYICVTTYKTTDYTYEEYLSGYTMIEAYDPSVRIESWKPGTGENFKESEYASWTKLTFNDWGWDDDTYTNVGKALGLYQQTRANKVFSGDITFSSDNAAWIYFGGANGKNWHGISLGSAKGSSDLTLGVAGETYTLSPSNTGITLIDNSFNLKMTYDIENNNSLKLGVWINDVLYNDAYIKIADFTHTVGSDTCTTTYEEYLTGPIMIQGAGSITLASDEAEPLPDLPEFTFDEFGIEDGVYNNPNGDLTPGYANVDFTNKIFSGNVKFTQTPVGMYLAGGVGNLWGGMSISSRAEDDSLVMSVGGESYVFTPEMAGTDLIDNTFNLRLSYEVVDVTVEEQTVQQLKLGVWFNNILYNDEYIYLTSDYDKYLLGNIGFTGAGELTIESIKDGKIGHYITETNTGDMNRVPYNNDDITADLDVGCGAYVAVADMNGDGYMDLLVGSNAKSYGGTYVFYGRADSQNAESEEGYLLMDKQRLILEAGNTFTGTMLYEDLDGDGKIEYDTEYVKTVLHYAIDPLTGGQSNKLIDATQYPNHIATPVASRFNAAKTRPDGTVAVGECVNTETQLLADYDGDGIMDYITSWGDWSAYSADGNNTPDQTLYDENGNWGDETNVMHGYVIWNKNNGTGIGVTEANWGDSQLVMVNDYTVEADSTKKIVADTETPLDVYGTPNAQFYDWDNDGDLDIVCAGFISKITYFENIAIQNGEKIYDEPTYVEGRKMPCAEGGDFDFDFCLPFLTSYDWNGDGYLDLICSEEDGRVSIAEHTGTFDKLGTPIMKAARYFQTPADNLHFNSNNTPVSVDWDGDGDEDIISGNEAGYVGFIENLTIKDGVLQGDLENPIWANPVYLTDENGDVFRITAGDTRVTGADGNLVTGGGSPQGPAENSFGYTQISVADWDGDDELEIMTCDVWGIVQTYEIARNKFQIVGTPTPVEVEWTNGEVKKPDYAWWDVGTSLVTLWRSSVFMIDLPTTANPSGDGLMDLVCVDKDGYLCFWERYNDNGTLKLKEGVRLFQYKDPSTGETSDFGLNAGLVHGQSGKVSFILSDFDLDDDLDLIRNEGTNFSIYRNIAENAGDYLFTNEAYPAEREELHTRLLQDHTPALTTCDWNQDGVPDLLAGAIDGTFYYMKNTMADYNNAIAVNTNMNLEITDNIAVNYVTTISNADETPTMNFAMKNGNVLQDVEGTLVEGTANTYQFTYPEVMAQDMATSIIATLKVGAYTKVYEYSVLDYCETILRGDYTEQAKELVLDLVQYGEAAQAYLGVEDVNELLTNKLAERLSDVSDYTSIDTDDDASALASLALVQDKLTGIASDDYKWKHATLVLGNKVKVRARFTANDVSNLIVKATINEVTQEIVPKKDTQYTDGNVYVLDFDNIYAYEYAKTITFQLCVNGEPIGQTLNYSVNTYLNAKCDYTGDNAETLKALLLAIHNYGKAASAYQTASN